MTKYPQHFICGNILKFQFQTIFHKCLDEGMCVESASQWKYPPSPPQKKESAVTHIANLDTVTPFFLLILLIA